MESNSSQPASWLRSFLLGAKEVSPVLLGIAPFGMVYGASAASIGLTELQAGLFSIIVFAGAAQLAALQLIAEQSPILVVVLTGLAVNLRFLMYSAAIAPHFSGYKVPTKLGVAYLLTDQAFAVSIVHFGKAKERFKVAYYVGAAIFLWVVWVFSTVAGIILGANIPPDWSLDFAVPLTFLAILFSVLKSRPDYVAAVASGAVAVFASVLPYNLGLMTGAVAGITAGFFLGGKPK